MSKPKQPLIAGHHLPAAYAPYWYAYEFTDSIVEVKNHLESQLTVRLAILAFGRGPEELGAIVIPPRATVRTSMKDSPAVIRSMATNTHTGSRELWGNGSRPNSALGAAILTALDPPGSSAGSFAAWILTENPTERLGVVTLFETGQDNVNPEQQEAVWLLPFEGMRAEFSVQNLGELPARVQIDLFGPDGALATRYAEIKPLSAQVFAVADVLETDTPPKCGGIRITNLERTGQTERSYLLARGRLIQEKLGFVSSFRFQDTLGDVVNASGSELHAPAVIFGRLDRILPGTRSIVRPHLVLRSTTRFPITVEPIVYGTDREGALVSWKLNTFKLEPLAVTHMDLEQHRRVANAPVADGFAGVRVIHDGGPTDIIAELISVEEKGKFAFYDPIRSQRLHRQAIQVATSFNLTPLHRSFLILKNTTDETQQVRVRLDYDDGKQSYVVNLPSVPPQQIAVVDILKLRDEQTPDLNGRVLPPDADFGGSVVFGKPGAFVISDPTFVAPPLVGSGPTKGEGDSTALGGPIDLGDDPFFVPSCGRGPGDIKDQDDKITTVKFWLNSFIPRDIPGQTEPAPNHPEQTMINPRFIPGCYLTDNRGFSNDVHAYSRLHSEIVIGVSGPRLLGEWHHGDYTRRIDCQTGEEVCTQQADTSRMHFSGLRGAASSVIQIDLMGSGHDPCTFGAGLIGDIDYIGTVTINVNARTVGFSGRVEPFPAFEAYATANDGAGALVFVIGPDPQAGPFSLAGPPNRQVDRTTGI